jgi:transcriptional regulator with XRE-family HTH domain
VARTPKARALGAALRQTREEKGLLLRELAAAIKRDMGVLSRWETGDRTPKPEQVAQILTKLDVNGDRYEDIMTLAYGTDESQWVAITLPEQRQQMAAYVDLEAERQPHRRGSTPACSGTAAGQRLYPGNHDSGRRADDGNRDAHHRPNRAQGSHHQAKSSRIAGTTRTGRAEPGHRREGAFALIESSRATAVNRTRTGQASIVFVGTRTWRKSRRSQNDANCVELRNTLDQARDSKNVAGPVLTGNMRALTRSIQDGRFNR